MLHWEGRLGPEAWLLQPATESLRHRLIRFALFHW